MLGGLFWSFCERPEPATSTFSSHIYKEDSIPLYLDLRRSNVTYPDQPGLIFVHGGGFSTGSRDAPPVQCFLDSMASKGITSASISYTLTRKGRGFGCDVPISEKQTAIRLAGQELMAAKNWLTKQAHLQLPRHWIAVGSSAGAEAALWAGYQSSPESWSGVVSFAGALDGQLNVPENAPPLFAIHGACDPVVPSRRSLHRQCSPKSPGAWMLCGGLCWADSLIEAGYAASTWTECEGGHRVCSTALVDPRVHEALLDWIQALPLGDNIAWRDGNGRLIRESQPSCPPCH